MMPGRGDARQAHAVMRHQHHKTDANNAELLAEIAHTGFRRPFAELSECLPQAAMSTAEQRRVLGFA